MQNGAVPAQIEDKPFADLARQGRRKQRRKDGPHDQGVPLPTPQDVD